MSKPVLHGNGQHVGSSNSPNLPPHDLINNVGNIYRTAKTVFGQADNNHAYRYVRLVENSLVGHDCQYAKTTHMLWIKSGQKDVTLDLLAKLRDAIDDVLELASSCTELAKTCIKETHGSEETK